MKKVLFMTVFVCMIALQPVAAQNGLDKQPFCTTCELENINADVYVVISDEIAGQLISGQFARITYSATEKDLSVAMSPEEIAKFLASDGFNYLKEGGDVYFTVQLGNQYFLVEVDRSGGSYGPLKIQTYEKTVRPNLTPFMQVIIPRPKKETS